MRFEWFWLIALVLFGGGQCATIYVNSTVTPSFPCGNITQPCATIQQGIDIAQTGDQVLVLSGIYNSTGNSNITFSGKQISVIGSNATIQCSSPSYIAFQFVSNETRDSILSGFLLNNCAINIVDSSPTISDILVNNFRAPQISVLTINQFANPLIRNSQFIFSTLSVSTITVNSSAANFTNCEFALYVNLTMDAYVISAVDSYVEIHNSYIHDNGMVSTIKLDGTIMKLVNTSFSQNLADIAVIYLKAKSELLISESVFLNNAGLFGVIYNEDSVVNISRSSFISNDAHQADGGGNNETPGIFLSKTPDSYFYIDHSNFTNNIGVSAGVILLENGQANFTFCNFTNNSGIKGGVIGVDSNDKGEFASKAVIGIKDCVFLGNYAQTSANAFGFGGVMFFYTYEALVYVDIENSGFYNNTADRGGVIAMLNQVEFLLEYYYDEPKTLKSSREEYGIGYVAIRNCEFSQNSALDFGGAIFGIGSLIHIENSFFSQNGGGQEGGALSLENVHNFTIIRSVFADNFATAGGAVSLQYNCSGIISDSSFLNNSAGLTGGALEITNSGDLVSFVNVQLAGNSATEGGAIRIDSSTFEMQNITFISNIAKSSGGSIRCEDSQGIINQAYISFESSLSGGGIYLSGKSRLNGTQMEITNCLAESGAAIFITDSAQMNLLDSDLHDHSSSNGGAIFVDKNGVLLVLSSEFASNKADSGGAIFFSGNSKGLIFNSHFHENQAMTSAGGAILVKIRGALALSNCTLNANFAFSFGGAIAMRELCSGIVVDSEIVLNQSPGEGAGIYIGESSQFIIQRSLISQNSAGTMGGGLTIADIANVTISDSVVAENYADSKGGGIVIENRCSPIFDSVLFADNKATGGGAIFLVGMANPTLLNCTFQNNSAVIEAGAIDQSDYTLGYFLNCTFQNNSVPSGAGAAIFLSDFAAPIFENVTFIQNSARSGTVCVSGSSNANFTDCRFLNNTAILDGGALNIGQSSQPIVNRCEFRYNQVTGSGGGIFVNDIAAPIISNSVISENSATARGGGFGVFGLAKPNCTNTMIDNNYATKGGGIFTDLGTLANFSSVWVWNNSAFYGGGMNVASGSFWDSQVNGNHAVEGGGGITVFQRITLQKASISVLRFHRMNVTQNRALLGGGVFIIHSDIPPNLWNDTNSNHPWHPNDEYVFVNATITGNSALSGGGLFYTVSGFRGVTFGPHLYLADNLAWHFGGGAYIAPTYSYEETWVTGGVWANNHAKWGGGAAAWFKRNQAQEFCRDCHFINNTASYQTAEHGYATQPTITTMQTGCPSSVFLNSDAFSIKIALLDDFGSQIAGNIVNLDHYNASIKVNNTEACEIHGVTFLPFEVDGTVTFENIYLSGKNLVTCILVIQAVSCAAVAIPSISCTVNLDGCPYPQVVQDGENSDTCGDSILGAWILVLAGLVLLAILGLTILVVGLIVRWILRKRRRKLKYAKLTNLVFSKQKDKELESESEFQSTTTAETSINSSEDVLHLE